VLAEPWSDRRISPFFSIGVGKFKNFPNLSLVGAEPTDAKLANASVGVRYYITDRFIARGRLLAVYGLRRRHPQHRVPRVDARAVVLLLRVFFEATQ
jgi:hypothetical protein